MRNPRPSTERAGSENRSSHDGDNPISDRMRGYSTPAARERWVGVAPSRVRETSITEEISRVAHHANGAPVAGFYTYGEIARTRGMSGFHNQTLVVLAVG